MPKKRLKMDTSKNIRRTLNRIANLTLNGELDPKTANALVYAANVCLGAIRVDDQEARIDELERLMEGINEQH